MAPILTFAWSKNKHQKQHHDIPDVAPSSSADGTISPAVSMHCMYEDDDTFYSVEPEAPPTPEGLKPRAALAEVRQQLGIPQYLSLTEAPKAPEAPEAPNAKHVDAQEFHRNTFSRVSILPRMPPPGVHSPQISNSSFYSKSSSERIAESPNLAAPTTAVGALVADSMVKHSNNINNNHSSMLLPPMQHPDRQYQYHAPMLPPRPWLMQDDEEEVRYQQLEDDDSSQDEEMMYDRYHHSDRHYRAESTSSSFTSSRVGLTEQETQQQSRGYNFDPIMHLNVSAISNKDEQSSLHSLSDREDHHHYYYRSDEPQDSTLLQRKRLNQRSQKERLILDCLERLMTDLDLVDKIEASEADGEWFLNTDMDEGLLCGFPEETKRQLSKYLQSITMEMDTARPEEFFLSPTQMEDFGETHQELRYALQFVNRLLRFEVTTEWQCKFEIRCEMGIEPETSSPEATVRGGDTSLFSLPEDSTTPHASNLSMATTITSKLGSPQEKRSKDAQVAKKTIAIMTTLVQRMSMACTRLTETDRAASPEAIRATEEMKRHYLQLMSLGNAELCIVADSFCPASMPLIRTVSLEEEPIPPLPPCVIRQTQRQEPRLLLEMFDDKGSNRIEEEDEDDLRRQVGSSDYDCNDVRDGVEYDDDERESIAGFYHQMTMKV